MRGGGNGPASAQSMGTGHQALWNMILSASQKKRATLERREFQSPPLRDMGTCGREGGNKILQEVLSIELLDFAATLWT